MKNPTMLITSNKRSLSILAAGLAVATLAGGAALAGPDGAGRGMGGPGMRRPGMALRRALSTLDLTDDQKSKVKTIVQNSRPGFEALHDQIKTDAAALKAAADATQANPAAVGAAFLKVRSDRLAVKAQRQKVLDDVKTILTPDQRTKLDGYIAGLKHGFNGRRVGRGRGPAAGQPGSDE